MISISSPDHYNDKNIAWRQYGKKNNLTEVCSTSQYFTKYYKTDVKKIPGRLDKLTTWQLTKDFVQAKNGTTTSARNLETLLFTNPCKLSSKKKRDGRLSQTKKVKPTPAVSLSIESQHWTRETGASHMWEQSYWVFHKFRRTHWRTKAPVMPQRRTTKLFRPIFSNDSHRKSMKNLLSTLWDTKVLVFGWAGD